MQNIQIGSNTYNLISMPTTPAIAQVTFGMDDTIAQVVNPFTRQTQTFAWPGADQWSAQITIPPMHASTAAPWKAFLASLQGSYNVLQLGDPSSPGLLGSGAGTPVVSMSQSDTNQPMQMVLYTRGWVASVANVLLAGDYLQIGYRLHIVTASVNSDSSGDAQVPIWPSIRDSLTDGQSIILNNPQGLFRLAQNTRNWHASPRTATNMSLNLIEVR